MTQDETFLQDILEHPDDDAPRLVSLSRNRTGDAGLIALAEANALPRLRSLELRNNFIADARAKTLAGSALLATVEVLDLRSNCIGDAGGKTLMESPHLGRLRSLSINRNKMSRAFRQAVQKHFEGRLKD